MRAGVLLRALCARPPCLHAHSYLCVCSSWVTAVITALSTALSCVGALYFKFRAIAHSSWCVPNPKMLWYTL